MGFCFSRQQIDSRPIWGPNKPENSQLVAKSPELDVMQAYAKEQKRL